MNREKQNFKEILANYDDNFIRKVATEYATTDIGTTFSTLCKDYLITKYAMKQLICYAIVNCIISYDIAYKIRNKATLNQISHCNSGCSKPASYAYYDKLLQERYNYVKYSLCDEKISEIISYYINHPELSSESVARQFNLSNTELNAIFKKALIFSIVDDKTADSLMEVAFKKSSSSFETYIALRKSYRLLNDRVSELSSQLDSYDSFISSDETSELSKQDLSEHLEKAKEQLRRFKDSF